jgi:hypothetical protein
MITCTGIWFKNVIRSSVLKWAVVNHTHVLVNKKFSILFKSFVNNLFGLWKYTPRGAIYIFVDGMNQQIICVYLKSL